MEVCFAKCKDQEQTFYMERPVIKKQQDLEETERFSGLVTSHINSHSAAQ